jgi:mono/diheme cytochrome c family protein
MADRTPDRARSSFPSLKVTLQLMATAAAALSLWFGGPAARSFAQEGAAGAPVEGAAGTEPEEEPAEWLAKPEELATVRTDRIIKSLRLNGIAMKLGREIYENECASCHGDDLKGRRDHHTPDLTDADWRFSGDDLQSGGLRKRPSDVEWTVRYGIRSNHPYTRGTEGAMLAFNPQYRTTDDTKDYGPREFLNAAEIDDVAEYVLELGSQKFDAAKAARGKALFFDNAKGNCFDCHGDDATGIDTIGSTNLTKTRLYLYGSDRASIIESITKGRHGFMPGFDDKLKPEEIKAVSVYVFSRAQVTPVRPDAAEAPRTSNTNPNNSPAMPRKKR